MDFPILSPRQQTGAIFVLVRNPSKSTLKIVASIDGVAVLDGTVVSFSKRRNSYHRIFPNFRR